VSARIRNSGGKATLWTPGFVILSVPAPRMWSWCLMLTVGSRSVRCAASFEACARRDAPTQSLYEIVGVSESSLGTIARLPG